MSPTTYTRTRYVVFSNADSKYTTMMDKTDRAPVLLKERCNHSFSALCRDNVLSRWDTET